MENIYDIRKKEGLLHILAKDRNCKMLSQEVMDKTAIVVNLYYLDTVKEYMAYLNIIPSAIAVYVFSSDSLVIERVEMYRSRQMYAYLKDNRGRDISALLVNFREYAMQYEYICFLHDKRARHQYLEEDIRIWNNNMWNNLLASEGYIYNVINVFKENKEIGLIVPPEPLGEYAHAWYGDAWNHNYEICKELERKLSLNCDIREDRQPITLSTVFWARTKALEKLFAYVWEYEDFPNEPMAIDGTISHGIERMLGYIAQDAGYNTATVMTKEYASWSLLFIQDSMKKMMKLMNTKCWIRDMHDVNLLLYTECRIRDFFEKNKRVYLYGAGELGKKYLSWCKVWQLQIAGFVVSDKMPVVSRVDGIEVFAVNELDLSEDIGIIITVAPNLYEEIESMLNRFDFVNYIYGYSIE